MTWKPPNTERKWEETLSAYHDEALPPEDQKALQEYLATDPARSEQLERIRQTSAILNKWGVETPPVREDFVRQFETRIKGKKHAAVREGSPSLWAKRNYRWFFQTAIFALGVVIGVFGTVLVVGDASRESLREVEGAPGGTTVNAVLSDDQAEALLQEVAATELVTRIKTNLRRKEWKKALSHYENLVNQYRDTLAASELEDDSRLTLLKRNIHQSGRI